MQGPWLFHALPLPAGVGPWEVPRPGSALQVALGLGLPVGTEGRQPAGGAAPVGKQGSGRGVPGLLGAGPPRKAQLDWRALWGGLVQKEPVMLGYVARGAPVHLQPESVVRCDLRASCRPWRVS